MKITVLTENSSCRTDCSSEHGLSLFVETNMFKLLFDAGQTNLFSDNADILGVDLNTVGAAVLSHGHYDHGGGLSRFLEINDHAKVYISEYAFEPYYSGAEKYIGLDPSLRGNRRLVSVSENIEFSENLHLIPWGNHAKSFPSESYGLNKIDNGRLVPDDFIHEQYVLIEENSRKILLSGCSHNGILNILERFHPDVLIGGFHFMKIPVEGSGRETLIDYALRLMKYDTEYFTCHCTGAEQYNILKSVMGNRLHYISAGMMIEI